MIEAGALIDHHCHGVAPRDLDRRAFEALFSEAHDPGSGFFGSQFDKPLGLLIRRHCAPMLDLEPHASADAYVTRRLDLGVAEVNRRLLRGAGVATMLIDTGHRADDILGCTEMAEAAATPVFEIVRIEAVFEEVVRNGGDAAPMLDAFADLLAERARDGVGLKSVVAYRASFAVDPARPEPAAVGTALDRWRRAIDTDGWRRLEDPVLLRHALWQGLDVCAERNFPLQLHVGFGDRDIAMHRCDPTIFAPFIAAAEQVNVPVTLLHCYPFEREAAWLAEVYANVFYDVGAVLNYAGALAGRVLRDAMEMGPFSKQLYSSDAFGLAELHYLGRVQFETALGAVLDGWIGDGACTTADAERIAAMIASGNARRIYPLPVS